MAAGPPRGAAGHDTPAPQPPASERLQLEVALLVAETTAASDDAVRATQDGALILLALADPDIRDYVRQCLRGQPNVRMVDERSGAHPFELARRLPADLLITDRSMGHGDAAHVRGIPVLLTGVELPEQFPVGDGLRIAFLLQPFNARRLLEAVEALLGDSRNGWVARGC